MCQINNIQKRFVVGTTCYKVLRNSPIYGYFSMYQRTPWKLGQIYKTHFYNHKLSSDIVKRLCSSSGSIGPGFFHAFPTLEEAIRFQRNLCGERCSSNFYAAMVRRFPIAEMRIPEDIDGFSGTYFDSGENFNSIAVPILEFVKIVDQNVSNK